VIAVLAMWDSVLTVKRLIDIAFLNTVNTSEHVAPNPSQTVWYLINLPQRDGRLSCPRWLGMYRDGLLVSRQSTIQVVSGPGVVSSMPMTIKILYVRLGVSRMHFKQKR